MQKNPLSTYLYEKGNIPKSKEEYRHKLIEKYPNDFINTTTAIQILLGGSIFIIYEKTRCYSISKTHHIAYEYDLSRYVGIMCFDIINFDLCYLQLYKDKLQETRPVLTAVIIFV